MNDTQKLDPALLELGITQDSDPEKEWVETQNKSKTLLAAL